MTTMMTRVTRGAIAGAAGTVALDAATYVDMAMRGRPPSKTPEEVVGRFAPGLDENRRNGIGSLMGFGVGIGVGAMYGLLSGNARPNPLAGGLALGAIAMAASDVPATRLGVTKPGSWSGVDWLSDIIPHALYGLCAALAFNAIGGTPEA